MSDAVEAITAARPPADTASSQNQGRSRHEHRTVEVFPVDTEQAKTPWAPFIKTIIRVNRRIWLRRAATGMWDQCGEVAYQVSSATGFSARTWGDIIRANWGIESRQHYVRHVTCDEDRSRIRDNPGIMARARSFSFNILREDGATNIAWALWNSALSLDTILGYNGI